MTQTVTCDAYFHMGQTHLVCQDYAAAGRFQDGYGSTSAYAIVSDGCSSAPDTDFGSRFMVRAAIEVMAEYRDQLLPRLYGIAVANRAWRSASACGMPKTCLQATLLAAVDAGPAICATMHGDGVVFARRRDGTEELYEVEYVSGAPDYPVYGLSHEDRVGYAAMSNDAERRFRCYSRPSGGAWGSDWTSWLTGSEPSQCSFPKGEYDLVAVASDGLSAFCDRRSEPIPLTAVAERAFAFKGTTGQFVTRRLRRFLTHECPELGWRGGDDVSVAAIFVGAPAPLPPETS